MGTDNIDIVLNELDAAVNIDPVTRTRNPGAAQTDHHKNRHFWCSRPIHYLWAPYFTALAHLPLTPSCLFTSTISRAIHNSQGSPIQPTYIPVPSATTPQFEGLMHGITATLPGFYGPQGRSIQIKSTFKETLQNLYKTQLGEFHITNFEMETSGIYALANLLGHEAHSFSALLANRTTNEFHPDPD